MFTNPFTTRSRARKAAELAQRAELAAKLSELVAELSVQRGAADSAIRRANELLDSVGELHQRAEQQGASLNQFQRELADTASDTASRVRDLAPIAVDEDIVLESPSLSMSTNERAVLRQGLQLARDNGVPMTTSVGSALNRLDSVPSAVAPYALVDSVRHALRLVDHDDTLQYVSERVGR